MDFQNSRTYQNILNAYQNQLSNNAKYNIFMRRAEQENLIELMHAFENTARNDLFIAERLRRIIMDGNPSTLDNLIEARSDKVVDSDLYREYARVAQEEGYDDLSSLFSGIANIMLNHNTVFNTFISEIQSNELFCKPAGGLWLCLGCGNILSANCAPERCPVCGYPQGYYMFYSAF
ncbi:MAG: rubrerythrin family protein [Clostridiales bacterium]|nr:rubrerythrin family protein [Clostridiales bacterium]